MNKCPYEVLGIPADERNADLSDTKVKSLYRKLALKYHPDRNKAPGAREKFEEIKMASEVLLNKDLRKKYLDL